jgi:hypothetical protein
VVGGSVVKARVPNRAAMWGRHDRPNIMVRVPQAPFAIDLRSCRFRVEMLVVTPSEDLHGGALEGG